MISVVIPVYNVEKYLDDCISSIVNQTFHDLEIIIVDDGSTDSSGTICDQWGMLDCRIRVIHKKNGGLSSARNEGIENATGQYIIFIDSDDIIHQDMLKDLHTCFEKNDCIQIACCGYLEVHSKTEIPSELKKVNSNLFSGPEAALHMLDPQERLNVVAWNKLYRRSLFKTIRFPDGYNHEDMYVIPKLLYESEFVSYTKTPYYYHRYNSESIVHKKYSRKSQDEILGVEAMQNFFLRVNCKKALIKTNRIYLWKLIDHYCKTKIYLNENKQVLIHEIFDKYQNAYREADLSKYPKRDILQFSFFRYFPELYFKIRKGKYI